MVGNDGRGLNLGFTTSPIKLGVPAETQALREAIVAIPYFLSWDGRKNFYSFQTIAENHLTGQSNMIDRWRNGSENVPQAMRDQFDRMNDFVLPPHLDFLRNPDVSPMVMYIFPFEYQLIDGDKVDLSSSLLREKLQSNLSSENDIPTQIISYIKKNSLY